jgi:hypothetical protein
MAAPNSPYDLSWGNDSSNRGTVDIAVFLNPAQAASVWFPNVDAGRNSRDVIFTQALDAKNASGTILSYFPSTFYQNSFLHTIGRILKGGVAAAVSIALSGTITASTTQADIVAGGKTIILTIANDTWIAAGAASFDLQRQNIINGLTSAQSELLGWNNVVKTLQGVAGVVRTSDTVVTITLDAQATYSITATETITATVPGTALTGGNQIVASPTFTVSPTASRLSSLLAMLGVG